MEENKVGKEKTMATLKEIFEWAYCIIIAIVLALLFRYFVGTPTIVQQPSMYPTLKSDQRLFLNRIIRTTKGDYERGDIVTFEAPTKVSYTIDEIDQSNPVAQYNYNPSNIFVKFSYYVLERNKTSYIKRVIATEGEHVRIANGKVYINDKELNEPYLQEDVVTTSNLYNDFIVPEGYLFLVGDNRGKSTDCRAFGCIPVEKIEGKVAFRFWPFNVFGAVE